MADSSMKLYGKKVCTKPECEKKANEEAGKATESLVSPVVKAFKEHGWDIQKGIAAKVIDQSEVTIDLSVYKDKKKAIRIAGYEYQYGLHNLIDDELKSLYGDLAKAEPAPKPKEPEVVKESKGDVKKMNEDTKNDLIQESMNPRKTENLPVRREKKELIVGTCEAVAVQYGIPTELANLFFMKMNEGLYIKNPGLLYLAGKKGYSRIEITDKYDENAQEWSAECKIYPKLTKEILEGISKLDKEMQKQAFDFLTNPTNGTGRASKSSVKMSTMQVFLREMAQTRAQNRALRAFTGYGGTSAEELPEGQVEVS